VQASCQKNYSFLTTDGFWNGTLSGKSVANVDIGNQDNVNTTAISTPPRPQPYCCPRQVLREPHERDVRRRAERRGDRGTTPGSSGTLADVAMYFYRNDLRGGKDLAGNNTGPITSPSTTPPNGDVSINNVPAKPNSVDFAVHQHMTTFTIGLADGLMRYQADYASNTNSDFFHIVNADIGACFWNGPSAVCNWPLPLADGQSALDDLWHAAVNGRGSFYSAVNPVALATGLSSALNSLDVNVASAAAAATSSPRSHRVMPRLSARPTRPAPGRARSLPKPSIRNGRCSRSQIVGRPQKAGHQGQPPSPCTPWPRTGSQDLRRRGKSRSPTLSSPNKLRDFVFTSLSATLPQQ